MTDRYFHKMQIVNDFKTTSHNFPVIRRMQFSILVQMFLPEIIEPIFPSCIYSIFSSSNSLLAQPFQIWWAFWYYCKISLSFFAYFFQIDLVLELQNQFRLVMLTLHCTLGESFIISVIRHIIIFLLIFQFH